VRQAWSYVTTIGLFGLLLVALAMGMPKPPVAADPPAMAWEPITVGMAVMLSDYADREDWSGCETRGVSPLFVRCPDGWTLKIS
jgi:hypothetical protein